jgi:hypothetical protein
LKDISDDHKDPRESLIIVNSGLKTPGCDKKCLPESAKIVASIANVYLSLAIRPMFPKGDALL